MSFNQPLSIHDVVAQGIVDAVTVDEAAMQYTLVSIEIFGALSTGPLLRDACAADASELAILDESLATLRAEETTLYGIADCGSAQAVEAYVSTHQAIERIGRLLGKHRLYFPAATQPGTGRAFARFEHDAMGAVEKALKGTSRYMANFHIRNYVDYRRSTDPTIAPLGR